MGNTSERWARYYVGDAQANLEARAGEWTPERLAEAEKAWIDLFNDVERILDQDPAGEAAQALAARWTALLESFTAGRRDVAQSAAAFYRDSPNWTADIKERMAPFRKPQVWEFMSRALAAYSGN